MRFNYLIVAGVLLSAGFVNQSQAGPALNQINNAGGNLSLVIPIASHNINGRNVTTVFYQGGMIEQNGSRWIERNNDGVHNFEETHRDDWSVYLIDRGRNMRLQIDLHRKMISFAMANGPMQPLYNILSVSGSGGIVSANPPSIQIVEYRCSGGIPLVVRYEDADNQSTAYISHNNLPEVRLDQVASDSGISYSNWQYTLSTRGREAWLEWGSSQDFCREN